MANYNTGMYFKNDEERKKAKSILTDAGISCNIMESFNAALRVEILKELESKGISKRYLNEVLKGVLIEEKILEDFQNIVRNEITELDY